MSEGAEVVVVIRYNLQTHQLQVSAPTDRVLAYGLLGMAREIVARGAEQPAAGRIVVPTLLPPKLVG
jgi:hypothetical protein